MEYSIQLNAVNQPGKRVCGHLQPLCSGTALRSANVACLRAARAISYPCPEFPHKGEGTNTTIRSIRNSANPITKEFREELYNDILKLYDEMEQTGKAEFRWRPEEPDEPEFTVRVNAF